MTVRQWRSVLVALPFVGGAVLVWLLAALLSVSR